MSPAFALLNRSLREDSRQRQTYVARGLLVGFVGFLLLSTQQASRYSGAPGLMFFGEIIWLNLWFISLAGLGYFAAAVAEEKEEATLGLLRMTNLGPLTILLGKSTSRLLGVALLLAAQLPFTLLAVTLGGVSAHQVLAGYAALGAYIFFLCNLALVFSVIFTRVGVASAATGAALTAFFVVPSWGGAALKGLIWIKLVSAQSGPVRGAQAVLNAFQTASPAGRLEQVMRTGFNGAVFGWQALADVLLGLACFGLAWMGFDRFTRERRGSGGSAAVALAGGKVPARRRPRRLAMWLAGRPWGWPVLWKDFHLVQGGWRGWVLLPVVYGGLALVIWYNIFYEGVGSMQSDLLQHRLSQLGETLFPIFLAVGAFQLALGCARIFRVEIQAKTLSGLGGLPVSMSAVVWQKVGALALAAVPTGIFALGGLALLASSRQHSIDFFQGWSAREWGHFLEAVFITGTQSLLFLCVTAYFSLRLKRLALPMAGAACFMGNSFIFSFMGMMFRGGSAEAGLVTCHLLLWGLIAALGLAIVRRLKALAAEES